MNKIVVTDSAKLSQKLVNGQKHILIPFQRSFLSYLCANPFILSVHKRIEIDPVKTLWMKIEALDLHTYVEFLMTEPYTSVEVKTSDRKRLIHS